MDRNPGFAKYAYGRIVALRKESVDRNGECLNNPVKVKGRSPQGERG